MKSVYQKAFKDLEAIAQERPQVLVAYSGGKDSLAVLDMCCKVFPTVRAFFKFIVPGLELLERQMRWAKERYNVDVIQFPSIGCLDSLQSGLWCDDLPLGVPHDGFPLRVSFQYAMQATGIDLIATGMKDADGLKRKQFFSNCRDGGHAQWWEHGVIHPIKSWRKKDVLDYLKVNNIPLPPTEEGSVCSGVGLDHNSLCWLHDDYPEDFERLLKWFPYAKACIYRRDWFGV